MVKCLVENGADVNKAHYYNTEHDSYYDTPLYYTLKSRDLENDIELVNDILFYLYENGAEIHISNIENSHERNLCLNYRPGANETFEKTFLYGGWQDHYIIKAYKFIKYLFENNLLDLEYNPIEYYQELQESKEKQNRSKCNVTENNTGYEQLHVLLKNNNMSPIKIKEAVKKCVDETISCNIS